VVRAGEAVEEIDAMRRAGIIALSFESVGDVRGMSTHEVEAAIASTRPEEPTATLRSRLMRLAADVHVGDLVVTPNMADREVWVSIVTGPYEYVADPPVPRYQHTRAANWLGWIERDASWLRHKLPNLETPMAIVELRDPNWWFAQIGLLDLPPDRPDRPRRPVTPVPAASAPRATRSRSATPRTTAPRAPRAPKPVAPPKPVEPALVLCAGQCGFQWRAAVLVDGLCPDCRGD
jgi:hypothetical protein